MGHGSLVYEDHHHQQQLKILGMIKLRDKVCCFQISLINTLHCKIGDYIKQLRLRVVCIVILTYISFKNRRLICQSENTLKTFAINRTF